MRKSTFSVLVLLAILSASMAAEHSGAVSFYRGQSSSTGAESIYSSRLLFDESTPYPTPAAAIQALNRAAEAKYRELTGDYATADLAVLGANGQKIAELAGYFVERRDQDGQPVFYVTELQQLSSRGGKTRGVRQNAGDKVWGYHTGQHTSTDAGGNNVMTILSNTDYKALIQSANEAEVAYDMAAQSVVGMDRQGNLFQLAANGDWVDLSGQKASFCGWTSATGLSRYDATDSFLQSTETVNEDPACVRETPSINSRDYVSSGMDALAVGNAASSENPAIPAEFAELAGQVATQIGEIQAQNHVCTSFEFEKDYIGAERKPYMKLYRCTECGQGTTVNVRDGETIEEIIAENKRDAALENQLYGFAQSALQNNAAIPSVQNVPQQTQENP